VNVIAVPATLDDRSFEQLVQGVASAGEGRVLVDARRLRWVDPYGLLGLLAAGEVLGGRGERPRLQLPESQDVLSYLGRMGFFRRAGDLFQVHGAPAGRQADGPSDVLLEITPVTSHVDVHRIVDRVNERALAILTRQLHYPLKEAFQFSVMLSELCQNIIEHAEAGGWVATQTYNWTRRLGRKVVSIAVVDLGVGFHGSLGKEHAGRYGDRWSDASALEAAFIHGLTRFHDPGRGQGLQQIRRQTGRWNGRIAIRSGTARIADVPSWSDAPPLEEGLAPFPGTQISIVLPSRVEAGEAAGPGAGVEP
jgi:anti-sigma regulatory factor (Ser/Thr protein kinase)